MKNKLLMQGTVILYKLSMMMMTMMMMMMMTTTTTRMMTIYHHFNFLTYPCTAIQCYLVTVTFISKHFFCYVSYKMI